ncbi:MAG: fumarylacetoacetase [Planctomycetia bacterium]|nr:fumarylacetoacetase [Planctomycetia bacterium]
MTSHSAPLQSWLPIPADSHFPLQNLPYGVFRPASGKEPRVGVAIGDFVLDLSVLEERGLLAAAAQSGKRVFNRPALNEFMVLGPAAWRQVRARVTELLRHDTATLQGDAPLREAALLRRDAVELLLPVQIGDYTDFYSSRDHATNVGTMLRGPQNALNPNWLHLPVAYQGRSSSVVVSGTDVVRPRGQTMPEGAASPSFGPSRALDYELELGFFIGTGNNLGESIACERAGEHVFGVVLVNDWSARDLQKWEYVPLGPFLAKNFATSISPWVVPLDALAPFRIPGPTQDPQPLPYLRSSGDWTFDIELEVTLTTAKSTEPFTICCSNARNLYWNICQQIAHHTVGGCNLRPGDLLATGTISGKTPESRGCLLERTWGGTQPLALPDGTLRRFLEDGDRLTITAWCQGDGYRVGLGEVTGKILPAAM